MKDKLLGGFCLASSGHDSGSVYIIVGTENGNYLVSDGKLKKIENPKKKNPKHVHLLEAINEEIHTKLCNGSRVSNEEVKRAIKLLDV